MSEEWNENPGDFAREWMQLTQRDETIYQMESRRGKFRLTTTAIEALTARLAQLEAERDSLAGIVQGWHYLAVGPDEMGDYYTHKQLVKLSEPYASPALRALKETRHD